MIIVLDIPDEDITRIAGENGKQFVVTELLRNPAWFFKNAKISVEVKCQNSAKKTRS